MKQLCCLFLMLAACGGPPESTTSETLPPSTDRDPPPYTPIVSDAATTGAVVALATSSGTEQGRSVALRFIEAIRDQDRSVLERLLAEQLFSAQPRLGGAQRPRAAVMRALTQPRRSGTLGPDTPIEQIIDMTHFQVQLLSESHTRIPDGLRPQDILVSVPLRNQHRTLIGRGALHRLIMVIRPGGNPRVVAL